MFQVREDLNDVLKAVGGAWGWLVAFGVIGILAGAAVLAFTRETLLVIALAFGLWLIFSGIFRFVGAFTVPMENGWLRALYALLAVFSLAVGVYLLGHPVLSLVLLAFLIGIFWIFHGVLELFIGIDYTALPHRGWTIVNGILGIIAGSIVLAVPGISIVALTWVLGVWMIIYGVIFVVAGFQARSRVREARLVLSHQP